MARKYTKRTRRNERTEQALECTALYIRVSTDRQADEGYSLAAQRERLGAYCQAQGWQVCETYTDEGISGKTENRPGYQAMLQAAKAGAIKRIVAMKLDRLSRNVKDFLQLVDDLKAVGVDLVLIKESFDTSTPHGKFALTMFAAMAELEASTITERVMSGKRQKAQGGGFNGSRAPFGYTYSDGVFSANDSARVVREMFNKFNSGNGMASIARWLNDTHVPTATGGTWHTSTVKYLLTNGFYAGLSQWDGVEESAGSHPAIIDVETYETTQRRLQAIKPGPQSHPVVYGRL